MSKVDPKQIKRVKQLLKTAPSSWKEMLRNKGTSNTAPLDEVISTVLSYTPSMRSSGTEGDAIYSPPKKVRDEAMLGLELSHREGYTSASGIGLVRAIQLVVEPKIWERSVLRMSKYFGRHGRDKNSSNFGNDSNPSRGYMAWLNWGGDSGKAWADKLVNKDNLSKSTIKNPVEISMKRFLQRFPRKWWYSNNDWKQMVDELKNQYDNPDNHYRGEFQLDEWSLESLDTILAGEKLSNLLESRGVPMIGLSADWASTAYGLGETQILMHYGKPVEVYESVLVEEEEDIDAPWSLLRFLGYMDLETDNAAYEVVKTELAEHYLEKLMAEEYAEFRQGLDEEPLQFPRLSNPRVAKKIIRDSKGRKIPQKYLTGYKGKKLTARKKEIEQRRDEYQAALDKYGDEDDFPKATIKKLYRPFKTDKGIKSKRSSYTVEAKNRGFTGSIENKAKQASQYYGAKISPSILKDVNKRGMAAWASGGHRPGQTSHSWGIARVNSFLVGGKAFFTSDSDLAKKLPKKVQTAIKKKRVWKG